MTARLFADQAERRQTPVVEHRLPIFRARPSSGGPRARELPRYRFAWATVMPGSNRTLFLLYMRVRLRGGRSKDQPLRPAHQILSATCTVQTGSGLPSRTMMETSAGSAMSRYRAFLGRR